MVAQFVLNLSYRKWTLKTDNIIVKKRVEVNKLTLFSYFVPLTYFPRKIRDWNKLPDSVVLAQFGCKTLSTIYSPVNVCPGFISGQTVTSFKTLLLFRPFQFITLWAIGLKYITCRTFITFRDANILGLILVLLPLLMRSNYLLLYLVITGQEMHFEDCLRVLKAWTF